MESRPSDQEDFTPINIHYHNYGIVPNDSVQITVKDTYNNSLSSEQYFKVPIPLLDDSIIVKVPIKNKVGVHNLTVVIDSTNAIDEIYKNDNQASLSFTVYSITLRAILGSNYYSTYNGGITFLNPTYANFDTANSKFDFQIDTTQNFSIPVQYENNLGVFSSTITIPNLLPQVRYWLRAKLSVSPTWSAPISFANMNQDYNWYTNSPIDSLSDINYSSTGFNSSDKAWELIPQKDELKISSAGYYAGPFASMQYNLQEMLPTTKFWGIGTALIDTVTLRPSNIQIFGSSDGTTQTRNKLADSLTNYINSLSNGTVLAMTICDDGAQSVLGYSPPTAVRDAIKELGSIYIDSVQYRDSWCIIGKKGAAPGTVPEVYKKQFEGIAIIDTSIIAKSDSGTIGFPSF